MIGTFSPTIRRREMDAVLTCMVDEKVGPGEMNGRLVQAVKESLGCDAAVALRAPEDALLLALRALQVPGGAKVMVSALAPRWHYSALESAGYEPLVLDVAESDGIVTPESAEEGASSGAKALVLHETLGILPEIGGFLSCGVPVIEDISQSYGASFVSADGSGDENPVRAGMAGSYAILGLEEHDAATCGGGAVLVAPRRRDWLPLKPLADALSSTEILPDINCALAFVQLKEFPRNEEVRRSYFAAYQQASLSGRHRILARNVEGSSACYFPVVLSGGFKEARQYAARKEIEIRLAFEDSVIAYRNEELAPSCRTANSLYLRTVLFPLYPLLGQKQASQVAKCIGTMP